MAFPNARYINFILRISEVRPLKSSLGCIRFELSASTKWSHKNGMACYAYPGH